MFVKPKNDKIIVREPATGKIIPSAGIEVPDFDSYWLRRLRDGDVVQIKPVVEVIQPQKKETHK